MPTMELPPISMNFGEILQHDSWRVSVVTLMDGTELVADAEIDVADSWLVGKFTNPHGEIREMLVRFAAIATITYR